MSSFRLLVTAAAFRDSAPASEAPILAAGGELVYPPRMGPLPADELIPLLRDVDAVVAATDPYTGPVLEACPRLRVVVRWGTGYDSVDVAACTAHGVVACNTPGLNVEAVADHTLLLLLGAARGLPRQLSVMGADAWEEIRGVELFHKTVGLVGFGAVGRAVARRLRGFECRVLAYDPHQSPEAVRDAGAEPADLPTLFAAADFVSIHAALTPESRGLVSRELIGRMRPGAYLVNTARGPLVDEDALVEALQAGRIAGAAVDAFCTEPLPAGHPLRHLPNCLATPHSAFNTVEASAAINAAVAEQVIAVLRGERPRYCLNPDVFESPALRGR